MMKRINVVLVPVVMLCLALPASTQVAVSFSDDAARANSGGWGLTEGRNKEGSAQEEKKSMKWGSLEFNPHLITSSLTPFGLNVGVIMLPYVEAELFARTGGSGSAFAGKISGNYLGGHIGRTPVIPYASLGYGLAFITELDDDPVGFWAFGAGLKVFLTRSIAIRTEFGYVNYEAGAGNDTAISLGLSFIPY